MSMKINIGIVQFRPLFGDPDANLLTVSGILSKVEHLDLIVLPELANSGYNFESVAQARSLAVDLNGSSFVKMLVSEAARLDTNIVCGINEIDDDKLYNTAILVNHSGIIGKYRKNHLYVDEQDFFMPGNLGAPVFKLDGFTIGIAICFDYLFPE